MFNLVLSGNADNIPGGYASGIDTEKLFTFLFIVMFIISLCLIGYIFYLKLKINKLESKETKEETSKN